MINSRLPGFYKRTTAERQAIISNAIPEKINFNDDLSLDQATAMIENVIGTYALPVGIATNFSINDRDYLIPMVIEEPSVVAAVSNAAKFFRAGGGFVTSSDAPIMIGQIQVLDVPNIPDAVERIRQNKTQLLANVNEATGSIVKRGGGARDIELRVIEDKTGKSQLIVHLLIDTRDAMGANAINTAVERIAPEIEALSEGRVHLRILSNLSDKRKAKATGVVPHSVLADNLESGKNIAHAIYEAAVFAEIDPYRAATHNKGIMNGIDAVAIATGNDWRAIEAGAHAYAVRGGHYSSLSEWHLDENGDLHGTLELPMAVGIVGGATRVHPMAQNCLKILNVQSSQELAEVMAAVGLAQNFAAMKALATDGIQHGHMRMHARQLAMAAGATAEQVGLIANQLINEKNIRLERANQLVQELMERSEL